MLMHRPAGSLKLPARIRKTPSETLSGLYQQQQAFSLRFYTRARARAQVPTPECIYSAEFQLPETARFVKITRNRVFFSSEGNRGCRVQLFYRRGFTRETAKPTKRRMPMHLHNCAYKFRTLPEGFARLTGPSLGGTSDAETERRRATARLHRRAAAVFVSSRGYTNSIPMNYLCEYASF